MKRPQRAVEKAVLAGLAGALAVVPVRTRSQGLPTAPYAERWELRPRSGPALTDPWRWSGRREQYERVEIREVLRDPWPYFDRRVHFRGKLSSADAYLAWMTLIGRPAGVSTGDTGFSNLRPTVHTSLGTYRIPPPADLRRAPPPRFVCDAECYGFVAPALGRGTEGADQPTVDLTLLIPGSHSDGAFTRVLRGEPGADAGTYLYMLARGMDLQLVQKAVAGYEQRLTSRSADPLQEKQDFVMLGWLHERYRNDYEKALLCYRRAHTDYRLIPGYQGVAWFRHGLCLERLGRREEARRVYVDFVRTYPQDLWATDALERLKRLGVKRKTLHLELNATEVTLTRRYLRQFSVGKYEDALATAERVASGCRYDPWSRLYAAYVSLLLGRTPAARLRLRELASVNPLFGQAASVLFQATAPVSEDRLREYPIAERTRAALMNLNAEWSGGEQMLAVLARDRHRAFPEDPVPHLLWASFSRSIYPQYRPDPGAEMRRALELAPRSWAVRLKALEVAYAQWPDGHNSSAALAKAAEELLRANERDTWALHEFLANLYASPPLADDAKSRAHGARYELLKRRYLPEGA